MSASEKLYRITTDDCVLPLHVKRDSAAYYPAHNLPQVLWPDGTVCWLVNLYLLSGYRKGRSRKNKGGTLLTWAKNLSHLIRWCYQNRIDFIDLTDSNFTMFVNTLRVEKHEKNVSKKKRGESQVTTICSTVLNFLAFVDERIPGLNLLGPEGSVRAEKKTVQIRSRNGGKPITRTYWTHEAVSPPRAPRRRQPISTSAVNRLFETNTTVHASSFVTRRRYIMLRLLEITGGRRMEVSLVTVADLEEAQKTGELRIYSAKQGDDETYRYVPVTQADLKDILSFVKHYRQRIIRTTIGLPNDHGFLFISENSGKHLEIDTLGSELSILRKAAQIDDEEACMHAFRHRFITNIFRDLIRTHHYQTPSDLRRALLSTETLKMKVMEWTGHKSIESLDHYIHLAFEAESDFKKTLNLLHAKKVVQSLQQILVDYGVQFREPKPKVASFIALAEVVEAAASELDGLLNTSESL
ncbi:Tyrosine recombinase XerD [Paraburkholderia ultramafica]|uniref:Tyrosine recombinase XerD n=1 Tax=Paraburkholderia ultramafica TaxID=1544867 RepID=A0A6S7CQ95_9BURK|nr:site-specific integrase [Paraburkholderia ultramafica]CAB3795179.1 Tyrosine recombinase XerD [Paraburkholderia ultramafica]